MSEPSDLMARKYASYVSRAGQDNDGVVTADQFNAIADRCIALTDGDPAKAQQIRATVQEAWNQIFQEYAEKQPLSIAAYAEAMKNCDPTIVINMTNAFSAMFFDLIDTNKDSFIGKDEFAVFYHLRGLDPQGAPDAFNAIDANQDGKLSREEFNAAYVDFITNDDPNSPFSHFFGVI